MGTATTRDTRLDTYRALIMIYIVCVIHTTYLFGVGTEPVLSAILFEMPVIFFIAGASQSVTDKQRSIKETIINRSKRILLPLYIFLFFAFTIAIFLTVTGTKIPPYTIDVRQFTTAGIAKVLLTGGCDIFPFYGYTWFISVYFIISCSLPIQQKLLHRIPATIYLAVMAAIVFVISPLHFIGEMELKHIPLYNFFYITGYIYYKQCPRRLFTATAIIATTVTVICFCDGNMIPMQAHKFPADALFLVFGTASLCLLTLVFRRTNIRYSYILRLWNERGYTIYLYQTVSHTIVYSATYSMIDAIDSHFLKFIIYAPLTFIVATMLSYITYPTEKYIINKLTAALHLLTSQTKNRQ